MVLLLTVLRIMRGPAVVERLAPWALVAMAG